MSRTAVIPRKAAHRKAAHRKAAPRRTRPGPMKLRTVLLTAVGWQYLFATSLVANVPVMVLFVFMERHLVAGLTAGGVRG